MVTAHLKRYLGMYAALRQQLCSVQQSKLEEKRRELANLDQKARDAKAKVKKAEDEVATAAAELESLPPPPQGNEEKKKGLQMQWKELDVQVWFMRALDSSSSHTLLMLFLHRSPVW